MTTITEYVLRNTKLYQRGQDGYPIGADEVMRRAWGPIPEAALFQRGLVYVPVAAVLGWDWSVTFGRWSALVVHTDGTRQWTFPRPY
jgi:hypothetical protein